MPALSSRACPPGEKPMPSPTAQPPSARTRARDAQRAINRQINMVNRKRREAHDLQVIACQQVGLAFGPVRLGSDCVDEATGYTTNNQPTAWMITHDGSPFVHPLARKPDPQPYTPQHSQAKAN